MSFGERLYLGLVLAAFASFGITLAAVAWRTERYLRNKKVEERSAGHPPLHKAA